jgi:hypothetical protein
MRVHINMKMEALKSTDPALELPGLEAGEGWSAQLFRSIDSGE